MPPFTRAPFDRCIGLGSIQGNKTAASLEGILDSLRFALQGTSVTRTKIGDAADSTTTRLDFHKKLDDLQNLPLFTSLAGQLIIKPVTANDLMDTARNNFNAIVALQDLSPFTLSAATQAGYSALESNWQSTRAADYAAWNADKVVTSPAAMPVNFSDNWIADRSALLRAISVRNTQDNTSGLVYDVGASADRTLLFQWFGADPLPGQTQPGQATLYYQRQGGLSPKEQFIAFGDDQANTLTGTPNTLGDRLYGGAGADTLDGQGGADYLEGGKDLDTYNFTGSFGIDTILDSDGQGELKFDGTALRVC